MKERCWAPAGKGSALSSRLAIRLLGCLLMYCLLCVPPAEAAQVRINNSATSAGPAYVTRGVYLVPARACLETFGATVTWDKARQALSAVRSEKTAYLQVGASYAYIDGIRHRLAQPVTIRRGTVYVPAEFFAKCFKASIQYDYARGDLLIFSNNRPPSQYELAEMIRVLPFQRANIATGNVNPGYPVVNPWLLHYVGGNLTKALALMKLAYPDWSIKYNAGTWDCSTMSAYLRYCLDTCGISTRIVRGFTADTTIPGHAWLEIGDQAIEATTLTLANQRKLREKFPFNQSIVTEGYYESDMYGMGGYSWFNMGYFYEKRQELERFAF